MLYFLTWYFILFLFAFAALPLGWTWFRYLPDRGWGLLRSLGLLLVGFTVWFLGSFGLLRLSAGSGVAGLLALFVFGLFTLHRWGDGSHALLSWLREHRMIIFVQEIVFLAAFAFWTWYRIHDGSGIGHTEQPMDFALMNAIQRGGEMPPNDPWLSGFAISYYYLGYLIMAQVAALTGVVSGVAYNLALTTLAGLASIGIFSLSYNLLAGAEQAVEDESEDHEGKTGARHFPSATHLKHLVIAFLAVILLLGVSNLTGLLTMTYHRGIGPDSLYTWFGVNDLVPDAATGARAPQEGWWWWKASRTVYDTGADGGRIEVIDEFPFFSFLLGDMHPHVLALPFTLLALTIAFNALRGALTYPNLYRWRVMMQPPESWQIGDSFGKLTLLLTAIVIGAMGMLNTWDYPTQLAIFALVWLIAALLGQRNQEWQTSLTSWVSGGAFLVLCALLLYLPFYVSFSSQANGIRVSQWSTAPQQYLLMFGLFWVVLIPLVLSQFNTILTVIRTIRQRVWLVSAMMLLIDGLILFLLLRANLDEGRLAILMAGFWLLVPLALSSFIRNEDPSPLAIIQVAGFPLLAGLLLQRFTIVLVAFFLLLSLSALWANVRALFPSSVDSDTFSDSDDEALHIEEREFNPPAIVQQASLIFALLLSAVAFLLTMGSDIFYIKDGFPGRMNTIFKLYYQAWVLMAIASTFGLLYLSKRLHLAVRVPWLALFSLLMLGSMWYPLEALPTKANFDGTANWDGRFWMQNNDPDRFAAIEWLDAHPEQVVILEKKGDSYRASESAFAGWTGHSTLIGWGGHELQWRGTYDEVGRREPVIEQIYQHTDPQSARTLVEEWKIDYVVVTPAERSAYNLTPRQVDKFRQFMTPVFEQGNVIIFGR